MSTRATQDESHDPLGEDGINLKTIVWVGVISLVVFGASAVIAKVILDHDVDRYEERGVAARGTEIGKPEIGIVDTVLFDDDRRLEGWQAEKARELGSYGWVDRAHGVVHIPVAAAMEQVVRQAAGGGTP